MKPFQSTSRAAAQSPARIFDGLAARRVFSWRAASALLLPALLAAGCSSILPASAPAPSLYALEYPAPKDAAAARPASSGPVLLVAPTLSAAGFDRSRMVYLRQPYKIEYFAQNQWVDNPARMLSPLLVSALERTGAFGAVLQTPNVAKGQLRLDTEILRLQQEFLDTPSKVRFTLRARLVDDETRGVIASREFEALVEAPTADPYGGVQASNQAVAKVLDQLAAFCAEQARSR